MIPANAIVLRSVKCSDIHKCIAGYGKATLYGVVDLGRKKFAKVFVMSYMGSRVLQEKLCHLKSTCIQAKQLQYNNDIHYVLMIFIFLHIRRFCISKGGSVPLPSDMRGSTVLECNILWEGLAVARSQTLYLKKQQVKGSASASVVRLAHQILDPRSCGPRLESVRDCCTRLGLL